MLTGTVSAAKPLTHYTWNVLSALSGAAACLFVRDIADLRRFLPRNYTIFGWLAAIGGAQRIIWPQATEAAIRWFLENPTSLVVAGIVWLVIGAVLCFYGYFRESAPGATK